MRRRSNPSRRRTHTSGDDGKHSTRNPTKMFLKRGGWACFGVGWLIFYRRRLGGDAEDLVEVLLLGRLRHLAVVSLGCDSRGRVRRDGNEERQLAGELQVLRLAAQVTSSDSNLCMMTSANVYRVLGQVRHPANKVQTNRNKLIISDGARTPRGLFIRRAAHASPCRPGFIRTAHVRKG